MNTEEDHDILVLSRKLDGLKAQGADRLKGGEYDRVLYRLRDLTRQRVGNMTGAP